MADTEDILRIGQEVGVIVLGQSGRREVGGPGSIRCSLVLDSPSCFAGTGSPNQVDRGGCNIGSSNKGVGARGHLQAGISGEDNVVADAQRGTTRHRARRIGARILINITACVRRYAMDIESVARDVGTCHIAEDEEQVVGAIVVERIGQGECSPLVGSESYGAAVVDQGKILRREEPVGSIDGGMSHIDLIGTLLSHILRHKGHAGDYPAVTDFSSGEDLLRIAIVVETIGGDVGAGTSAIADSVGKSLSLVERNARESGCSERHAIAVGSE